MATKKDFAAPDPIPDNDAAAQENEEESFVENGGPLYREEKYEQIRNAAASLDPRSRKELERLINEMERTPPAKSISMLMTGKTGSGKSTLTNGILGFKEAKQGDAISGRCTTEVTSYGIQRNGVQIVVWDSPGLQDGTPFQKDYLEQMKSKCSEVDLTMYCTKVIETRFVRGEENPDVVAMGKLTKALGVKFWKKTIIVLTYANTLEAFNPEWEDLSKEEKAEKFWEKIEEWEKQIKVILIDDIKVPYEIVSEIRIFPAGHTRKPSLPGIDYWLTNLWFQCIWTMPTIGARKAMVKINEKRIKGEDEVSKDDFKKPAEEQPLVVGKSNVGANVALYGAGGGIGGAATLGATIGLCGGGPPGAIIGAVIGGVLGALIGGGTGYAFAEK